jgi:hypothetical protein
MERTISYITIFKHLISVFLGFNYSTVLEFVFAFYLSIVIGETFAYGSISMQIMLLFAIIYSGAYFVFYKKAGDSTLQSTVEDCNDETELPNASGDPKKNNPKDEFSHSQLKKHTLIFPHTPVKVS